MMRILLSLLTLLLALTASGQQPGNPFQPWKAGTVVTASQVEAYGEDRCFQVVDIPDAVFARMNGKSYRDNPNIRRSDLRYLRVLHVDIDGRILLGEMVCNKAIARDLVDIFRELYRQRYPIERMTLIDDYDADDERSMRANNSSCFCYRVVSSSRHLSKHALGMAVDINTLYNPYVYTRSNGVRVVEPKTGAPYVDRSKAFPYKLRKGDLCHRLFLQHGFRWGGSWNNRKDYQHFEK